MQKSFQTGLFEKYIATRRSAETARTYRGSIKRLVGEPDAFLDRAKANRQTAEEELIDYIMARKKEVAAYTLSVWVAMTKSFLSYYEVPMNWKRINSVIPQKRRVALDRAPTLQEIRTLLSVASPREWVMILMLCSSGMRVGAFNYLSVGDVEFLPSGLGKVRVYRGEPDEYVTFISPEAVEALHKYMEARERTKESIDRHSPLIRDKWDSEQHNVSTKPTMLAARSIQIMLSRLWKRSGVRAESKNNRYEFKELHGFRKFFKTQATRGITRFEVVELLMGHTMNYFRPSIEELEQEYLKAVPHLTIAESEQLKNELEKTEKKHQEQYVPMRLELLELKEKIREQEEQTKKLMNAFLESRMEERLEAIRNHAAKV